MKMPPDMSSMIRMSSSTYTRRTLQSGFSLFQGRSCHTAFTGTHLSFTKPPPIGMNGIPGASWIWVRSSSIVSWSPSSFRFLASVTTRPPKVGRSLNQPTMGMTVRAKRVVSKSDSRVWAPKSILCVTSPTVDTPQEPTCSRWSLKNRSLFSLLFRAASMAKKNGLLRNNSTEEYTNSHEPATFSSLMWHGCSSTNCATSRFISASLSSMALDTSLLSRWPRSVRAAMRRILR
mmetsp:Transcript_11557/g.20885  ORF Transcript_11557/g.20885 Transcript_11557/m.20885 type:complete len:233 (+) Transcript_11557:1263-1961(+)